MTNDLNSNKEEKIIQDLLYEKSAKEFLLNQNADQRSIVIRWIYRIAAVTAIIIMAWVANNFFDTQSPDRYAQAKSNYEFPIITKSRSAQTNIIDQYIEQINNKEYSDILPLLSGDSLSEKDLYVKAHLYFATDSLEAARAIILNTQWKDDYYRAEMHWLEFLISYSLGTSIENLEVSIDKLDDTYKRKAVELIEKLKD